MDWQHFKDDVFNGLVSGVTVLVVLGTGGKTLLEYWFKKDFKRFETTLDGIANKEQTKFGLLHTESANAAKVIFAQITVMMRAFTLHVSACAMGVEEQIAEWEQRKGVLQDNFVKEIQALKTQAENNRIFFSEATNLLIGEVVQYAFEYSSCTEIAEEKLGNVQMEMITRISSVELNFKNFLGVTEVTE